MGLPLGPDDLGGLFSDPEAPRLLLGFAHNSPATPDDDLFVEIQSFGAQPWGPAPFMPRPGGATPDKGARLLVALDDQGNPWVAVWEN